jgi:hypothetical protein
MPANNEMKKWLSGSLFAVWFLAVSFVIASAMGLHSAALPQTRAGAASFPNGSWQMVHVLLGDCGCSRIVADHLANRGPLGDANEQIWIVGDASKMRDNLIAHRFYVRSIDAADLASQYGINGGPWLLVIDPSGAIAYSGGYSPHPIQHDSDPQERQILDQIRAGQHVKAFPAFGCAASDWLRHSIDPLGIKG